MHPIAVSSLLTHNDPIGGGLEKKRSGLIDDDVE